MKVIYFVAINILAIVLICVVNMVSFINNVTHTNEIYFWIMSYALVIGCSIIGMNCRNQILRLEELIEVKLSLEPTDEEITELMQLDLSDEEIV